jgi:hypothetical protein
MYVCKTFDRKFHGTFHSNFLHLGCRLWLKCIPDVRVCRLEQPEAVYRLILTRQWILGLHRILGTSCAWEQLLAALDGLSMQKLAYSCLLNVRHFHVEIHISGRLSCGVQCREDEKDIQNFQLVLIFEAALVSWLPRISAWYKMERP